MGVILKTALLDGAQATQTVDLYSSTISYLIGGIGSINDAMSAAPALGTSDGVGICTSKSAMAKYPDATTANVICTYTMNFGYVTTSGSIKSEQYSYDRLGNQVNVGYTDGGKFDYYAAIYNKQLPTAVYTATRYENSDAMTLAGSGLAVMNSTTFLGKPIHTVMLMSCDAQPVAPGWYNNRYVWGYNKEGYIPLIAYFNRWGRITPDITRPAGPPFTKDTSGNGWVCPDSVDTVDFATPFTWVDTLLGV